MTTLQPRSPYTQDELSVLYPQGLQLEQVQVLLRHGERSPVSSRFRNAGLPAYWPYCNVARNMRSAMMAPNNNWDSMAWQRKLETFNDTDDSAHIARGPKGETEGICLPGELSDKGRETTLALGERLRNLYVDQLKFVPSDLQDTKSIYLRATPIPRALESVQQVFLGMYPPSCRSPGATAPAIVLRSASDETLFPNEGGCARFAQLAEAFGERAAARWNETDDMKYLNKMFGKWMPKESPEVKVDSHPRLSGIMDTVNSTLAHGPETKLPKEFYDQRAVAIIDKIGVEEWFAGYKESNEYRRLGIGGLVGDVVARMVERARAKESLTTKGNELANGQGIRLALSGCHDTTLAAVLASMGAFENEKWPPYTSHIAIELFRAKQSSTTPSSPAVATGLSSWWSSLFGPAKDILTPPPSSRTPLTQLAEKDKEALGGYYVRMRFNDRVMTVPGCKAAGKHYENDESICTLEAFKEIADKFTPKKWKAECKMNMGKPAEPATKEPAGY